MKNEEAVADKLLSRVIEAETQDNALSAIVVYRAFIEAVNVRERKLVTGYPENALFEAQSNSYPQA